MRRRSHACALGVAVGAFLASGVAFANPLDAFGFGSRETALGGAASADVRGTAANYYNPASIVRAQGLELSIGYMSVAHNLAINGKNTRVDPVRGLNFGIVAPGQLFRIPFAFGLALHLPDDRVSRVRALRQEEPRWELYDNRNQRLYLAANLAIAPFDWLEIGGGLSFMASTRGSLGITGEADIFKSEQSTLRHQVDADLTAVRYPQFGARVHFDETFALAVVYRGQFKLKLDLAADVQGDLARLTTASYQLETHSVNNFLPQQWVFGGSAGFLKRGRRSLVHVNFDLTWVNWSAYEAPVASLDAKLDIPAPPGGWPAGITPPATPQKTVIVPLQLHDRFVPHVGVELRAPVGQRLEMATRLGYELAISPVDDQTGFTNYIDRDRHSFSAGLGVRISGRALANVVREVGIDMHGQVSTLVERTTQKTDPSDFVGDYRAGGSVFNVGMTLTVGFGR